MIDSVKGLDFNESVRLSLGSGVFFEQIVDFIDVNFPRRVTLVVEPGRYVVSDATVLLTRVCGVKETSYGVWILVDGGINLMPTAGADEFHKIEILGKPYPECSHRVFKLAGPLCHSGDILSNHVVLPANVTVGDVLIIYDAGAYTVSEAAPSNVGRPPVIAVDGENCYVCWRGEKPFDNILRFDTCVFNAVSTA